MLEKLDAQNTNDLLSSRTPMMMMRIKNVFFMTRLTYFSRARDLFKYLVLVIRKKNCITATSVPFEKLFSRAGLISSKLRNRIQLEFSEKLDLLSYKIE